MVSIIGHEQLIAHFQHLQKEQSLGQSYLFVGPASIGKKTVVNHLIQGFFCTGSTAPSLFAEQEESPSSHCGTCDSCKMFLQQTHPDYLFISKPADKQTISVDAIRDVIQQAYRSPVFGSRKYLLIDNAHTMTIAAANALLKTLEEPPASCAIFLISEHPTRMPQTILSRCEIFEINAINQSSVPDDPAIWRKSRYLPGIYQQFKSDTSYGDSFTDELNFFLQFISASPGKRLALLEPHFKQKKGTHSEKKLLWENRLQLWKIFFRDLLMLKLNTGDLAYFTELEEMSLPNFSEEELVQIQTDLSKLLQTIHTSFNLRLQMEAFAIGIS